MGWANGGYGDFNLFQVLGRGVRNENDLARSNAGDIGARLHSGKEENETNRLTLTHMVEVINGHFQSIRAQYESGNQNSSRETDGGSE